MDVLKKIPHRHFVFSIPKILRRYFLYDRKLLADLSRCAWESLKVFIQEAVPENDPIPYLGLGPAAHSFTGRERRHNCRDLRAYIEALASGGSPVESRESLSDEQLRLEALFLGFRMRRGICLEAFQSRYGRDLLAEPPGLVKRLMQEGLVELMDGFLRPTRTGMAVADSLALV